MKYALLASIALPALMGSAQAAVISSTSQDLPPFSSIIAPSPTAGATGFGTATADVEAGGTLVARSPFENVSGYTNAPFSYVLGGGSATFTAAANPSFVTGGDSFSFIFGSPDSYNTVSFSLGGVAVGSVTGSSPLFTSPGVGYYVTTVSGIGNYDAVTFASSTNSIEFATFNVSSVPLPAGLPMFGGAILVLGGFAMVRRARVGARVNAAA